MAKSVKEDLSKLLQVSKEQNRVVPTQKVVPVIDEKKREYQRLGLKINYTDYENLLRFVNYKIIDEKQHSYKLADAISDGIHLLYAKYNFERGMPTSKMTVGRKDQTTMTESKETTVTISDEDLAILNDYIYYKRIVERNTKFSRIDFSRELVEQLKNSSPKAFKQ
jgi:hypothetical protein